MLRERWLIPNVSYTRMYFLCCFDLHRFRGGAAIDRHRCLRGCIYKCAFYISTCAMGIKVAWSVARCEEGMMCGGCGKSHRESFYRRTSHTYTIGDDIRCTFVHPAAVATTTAERKSGSKQVIHQLWCNLSMRIENQFNV